MRTLVFGIVGLAFTASICVACGATDDPAARPEVSAGGSVAAGAHAGTNGAGPGVIAGSGGKGGIGATNASGGAASGGATSGGKAGGTGAGGNGGSTGAGGNGGSAGAGGILGNGGNGGASGSSSKGGAGGMDASGGASAGTSTGGSSPKGPRVVAYLPNYSGSYGDWATKVDFAKMTHLNLAFATATQSNDWDMGASDADVNALVTAAHAHGIKVLASLGGGGGDQSVIARYKNEGNLPALIDNLDKLVSKHGLDGADVDIEDAANLGASYTKFVDQIVQKLRPKGKLVTVATAHYLQDAMSDATLHQFDFVNVMIYSSYADSVAALDYYSQQKAVPKDKLTLGAGFFGTDAGGTEYGYADILKADAQAWDKDQASVGGKTVSYTGVASMKKLADYSKGFGGIMFWELSLDVSGPHSLYKTIQNEM